MVFLIQHARNRDTRIIQLKLIELIAASEGASGRLIDLEDLSEDEIKALSERFRRLAREAARLERGAHTSVEEGLGTVETMVQGRLKAEPVK